LGFLRFAARFDDLVKRFDFPARGVPLEFFDSLKRRRNGKICNEFPIDRITFRWSFTFLSVNDCQLQFRISALLTDRRKNANTVVCFILSSQRTLSFSSIGTRVGLIFFLSALVPLNSFLVQNLMAEIPNGSPSVVTTRLECIRMPHVV